MTNYVEIVLYIQFDMLNVSQPHCKNSGVGVTLSHGAVVTPWCQWNTTVLAEHQDSLLWCHNNT